MRENKEIKKCVKDLRLLSGKLRSQCCDDELCTNCKLAIKNDDCILARLIMSINALEKILLDGEKKR